MSQTLDGNAVPGSLNSTLRLGAVQDGVDATITLALLQTVFQALDGDLTAIAALTTTSFGRAALEWANAAAGRTALALGTAATQNTGAFDAAGAAAAAQAASQPLDSDLTSIAALTTTAYGRAFLALADAAEGRTALLAELAGSANTAASASLRVSGAVAETFKRVGPTMGQSAMLATGRLHMVAIDLPAGLTVNAITFVSGTTAAVLPLNQWFSLHDSSRAVLRQTVDDTTTAWNASSAKTLALTSAFPTTYAGLHYVGINVTATTPPSLIIAAGSLLLNGFAPITTGFSTTGLTTPGSLSSPAAAMTAQTNSPWAYLS